MQISIDFPHPDAVLGPNSYVPANARAVARKNALKFRVKGETRRMAYLRALQASFYMPQRCFPARTYEVHWYYKGRKPDADNIVARLKPILDGCAEAFGIDDRELELAGVHRVHTLGDMAGKVVIIFKTEN